MHAAARSAKQILCSGYAAAYVLNDDSILLTKLEPIKVKGKEVFIEIYEARARERCCYFILSSSRHSARCWWESTM